MFYCNPCAEEKGWPKSFVISNGKCEVCEKYAMCNDVPSSQLPKPKKDITINGDVFYKSERRTEHGCCWDVMIAKKSDEKGDKSHTYSDKEEIICETSDDNVEFILDALNNKSDFVIKTNKQDSVDDKWKAIKGALFNAISSFREEAARIDTKEETKQEMVEVQSLLIKYLK